MGSIGGGRNSENQTSSIPTFDEFKKGWFEREEITEEDLWNMGTPEYTEYERRAREAYRAEYVLPSWTQEELDRAYDSAVETENRELMQEVLIELNRRSKSKSEDRTVELWGVTYTEKQIEEQIAEDNAKIREYQNQLLGLKENSKQSKNIHSKLRARQSDLLAFTAAKKRLK